MRTDESHLVRVKRVEDRALEKAVFHEEAKKEEPAKETKKQQSERWEGNQVGVGCWRLRDKLAVGGLPEDSGASETGVVRMKNRFLDL